MSDEQQLQQLLGMTQATADNLRASVSFLDIAMQQAKIPVFELNIQGTIEYANQAALAHFALTPARLIGQSLQNFFVDTLFFARYLKTVQERPTETLRWQAQMQCEAWDAPQVRSVSAQTSTVLKKKQQRIILWLPEADAETTDATPEQPSTLTDQTVLSMTAPVYGRDLAKMLKRLQCTAPQLSRILNVTMYTWNRWEKTPDEVITNRTVELHLRLLDQYPSLLQVPMSPGELQQHLQRYLNQPSKHTDLALLLGVEVHTAKPWQEGKKISETAWGLSNTLGLMLKTLPPDAWDRYRAIVNQQAQIEGVDLWEDRSWRQSKLRQRKKPVVHKRGRPKKNHFP